MGHKRTQLPSWAELDAALRYEPGSGRFIRRSTGQLTGSVHKNTGYMSIWLNGRSYQAHRLAWVMTYGWCPHELDHINGDRQDNRICNLRPATRVQQMQNRVVAKSNRLGVKGVRRLKNGRYRARITINGKRSLIGDFPTSGDAYAAYCRAAHKAFGEYARTA